MSKIVQAVNAMIANPDQITNVIQGDEEMFFLVKGKYKWSMGKRDDEYFLWFYPGDQRLEQLASYTGGDWHDSGTPMVLYKDSDIGTREAKASFAELYTLLKERLYGVNEVLDDIISADDDMPF